MTKAAPSLSSTTRFYRKIHRWVALPLLLFMMLVGATGLLLGWKKHINLLPKTEKGSSTNSAEWVPVERLCQVAQAYSTQVLNAPSDIDRIDIRPQKGIAKIVFSQHFTELQLDCKTAKILSVNTRKSDFIEKIHDASIVDYLLDTPNESVKVTYTTLVSVGLMVLSFSGFWLWYNPIRIRKQKNT